MSPRRHVGRREELGGRLLARVMVVAVMVAAAFAAPARAEPPNVPAVDAPQLAALGPFGVGVESLTLVQPRQPDVLAYDAATRTLPIRDRAARPWR